MTTLFRILATLPLGLAQGLGWVLGWLVFVGSGVYRKRFLANARQAGVGWRQCLCAVGASGKLIAELPRLWFGRPVPVQWEGADLVELALARGRGVVFLTPHLGCFEIAAQAYAQRFGQTQHPITVLFRPSRQSWLRTLIATARQRPGLHTAPTTLAGVKRILKALKLGHSVGLLPDQVPPLGMGIWLPFFGRSAYTMTLSVRLAQQTGATVMMVWGKRLSWGRGYRLHFTQLKGELPEDPAQAALVINQTLEDLIRSCPQQYLWGYARYKQPRQET
jgi:KDO2-lipid IV(A) lauroyltransferase